MVQTFSLAGAAPDIPNPHDCVIRRIYQDNDSIVFEFEDDITKFDSAKFYCPTAKSLIIRYHLPDMDYVLYQGRTRKKSDRYVTNYTAMPNGRLFRLTERKYKLEYLYHFVSNFSMILVLASGQELRLELPDIDYVEYEWVE